MRIVLAGKHELSVDLARSLLGAPDIKISFLTCRSEEDNSCKRPSLRAFLRERGIQPLNQGFDHADLLNAVQEHRPDVLISAGYDRIFRRDLLDSVPIALNVHFGLLPRYRGCYSVPWAILNDEPRIGLTLHQIDVGIDSGPIVAQESIANSPEYSCKDIYLLLIQQATPLVTRVVDELYQGKELKFEAQNEELATYYPPQFSNDYHIPWRQTIKTVRNYIRAVHFPPYFPACSFWEEKLVGFEYPVATIQDRVQSISSGTIIRFENSYGVTALNGLIMPGIVQIQNDRMPFERVVEKYDLLGYQFKK